MSKKINQPPVNPVTGRLPDTAKIEEVAAEVPLHERQRRAVLMNIQPQAARYMVEHDLGVDPKDRAAFLLGWLACADNVKSALG